MIYAKNFVQWLTVMAVLLLLGWSVEGRSANQRKQQKSSAAPGKARTCPENDHYCVLELPRTASEEQIKKQFRKLAKIYHPDKNRDHRAAAEAQFVLISKAYEVLSDEKSRRDYDHELRYGQAPGQHPFQRQQHPGHGDPSDDIFRTFQSMFGDDVHQRGPGGPAGGFSARQQQQQQFQRAQYQRRQNFQQASSHYDSQRPNQKVFFTQRGPDGRTYYYEYTTQQGRPSFTGDAGGDDGDNDFDPFAYMFDPQYRSRHSSAGSFQWHSDFTPTSPWARFAWQVAYYVFFVYAMLSVFACCSGPAPRRPEPPAARDHRPGARDDGDEAQDAARSSARRSDAPRSASKPPKPPADPAAFPLPVISAKEIAETRGIIFVVGASHEAELLLRRRRRAFSQDPVLFRRYHRHDATGAADAAKKYEEIKTLERLFSPRRSPGQRLGGAAPTRSTPSAAATSEADTATAAATAAAVWRVVAVSKSGGKFAVYDPPASALRLLALASAAPSDEERSKATREAEEAVAKGVDEWLSRLVQGLEPWLTASA